MHTLRFVHPLQNELQQLLMCFTSSHLFLCFIEILSKNGPPFFVHSQKSTDHRTKFRHKNQHVDLSGVWLCGAPQHCCGCPSFHHFIMSKMVIFVGNDDFFRWFEGFQFRQIRYVCCFFFKKRKPFPEIRPFPKRESSLPSTKIIRGSVLVSGRFFVSVLEAFDFGQFCVSSNELTEEFSTDQWYGYMFFFWMFRTSRIVINGGVLWYFSAWVLQCPYLIKETNNPLEGVIRDPMALVIGCMVGFHGSPWISLRRRSWPLIILES